MQYKYSKKAGALNDASINPPTVGTQRARSAPPMPMVQQQAVFDEISVENMLTESAVEENEVGQDYASAHDTQVGIARGPVGTHAQTLGTTLAGHAALAIPTSGTAGGLDTTAAITRRSGMFFFTVEDGQRVLAVARDGSMEVIVGPKRVWKAWRTFRPMAHYVAHPGEFLIVRYRDGRQEHLAGPAHVWEDVREHQSIDKEEALPIAAKEAVVVYGTGDDSTVTRRIVHGPATFVPEPGEWLHTFSWHGSKGGRAGYLKVPNALVFQKLWLMPDQMYHDITDVRTADDAVVTIRLMMFFELVDIEKMLETTHDPIGDFVNAAASDVVDFIGRHDFESFKRHTAELNDLKTYKQLVSRAEQCGYRMGKVVYRGYGAPENLQRMHDEAIESRTRLQLEKATEQQAQELEDFKLDRTVGRAAKEREEQAAEQAARRAEQSRQSDHEIELAAERQAAALKNDEVRREFERAQREADAKQAQELAAAANAGRREHLSALKKLGVELTELLTQGRADQVIELRGGGAETAHVHLPGTPAEADE